MEPSTHDRPASILVGAAVVGLAALFLVAQAWDALSSLGSLQTQDWLSGSSSDPARVRDLTDFVHAIILIGATAAVLGVVFAVFAVQGHRQARIALVASAFVAGLCGLFMDRQMILVPAVAIGYGAFMMVGSVPARSWWNGRPVPGPGREVDRRRAPRAPAVAPRVATATAPAPLAAPAVAEPVAPGGPRPPALVAALAATWLATGLGILGVGGGVVATVANRAAIVGWARTRFSLDPLSVSALEASALVLLGLTVIGAGLIGLALLGIAVHRGSSAARFLLLLGTVCAAGLGLTAAISAELSLTALVFSTTTSVIALVAAALLLAPSVSTYFGDRPAPPEPLLPQASQPPAVPPEQPRADDVEPRPDDRRFPPAW